MLTKITKHARFDINYRIKHTIYSTHQLLGQVAYEHSACQERFFE